MLAVPAASPAGLRNGRFLTLSRLISVRQGVLDRVFGDLDLLHRLVAMTSALQITAQVQRTHKFIDHGCCHVRRGMRLGVPSINGRKRTIAAAHKAFHNVSFSAQYGARHGDRAKAGA
jgi:hypothetical protein